MVSLDRRSSCQPNSNLSERGSHEPGTFWYYNNWDFNALTCLCRYQFGKVENRCIFRNCRYKHIILQIRKSSIAPHLACLSWMRQQIHSLFRLARHACAIRARSKTCFTMSPLLFHGINIPRLKVGCVSACPCCAKTARMKSSLPISMRALSTFVMQPTISWNVLRTTTWTTRQREPLDLPICFMSAKLVCQSRMCPHRQRY
ncbi:MAG: hypothetical protein E6I97_26695 [Chloroflexi bacterium]|nr:MAG: hypothetical protein E6I97_26695 [Chloroflexota bacterium]